ncbi:molybdate transport system ATP-binding protein [Variovorax sp. YR752]|uniref:ABC transporter ATP-binding protein n=1 Tax=Variovorax sp. YR752 TaxID=1884383 RepID=UPI000BD2D447|nr:ATP-binding cassette domain-containing protein [Variovorax sp. YR752]SOD25073.1 molybdate transport system ATP-binding protein [Variovorax sp. YR752]
MIDVDLKLTVADGRRRFDLAVRFATDVPFAALYGPSGAGKSLTLQAIAGLLHPSSGHVRLDGRTLYDSAQGIDVPAPARRIGYLFQDYALFPHLSVRENVAFGLTAWHRRKPAAKDAERVHALLESFGLAALADSRPQNLSGGQQQRVALARALACEPQVLLLDEPFAALNPMLRAELRNELAQVRRQWGIPVLMITHDIEDVLALADVAFVYKDGQVVREIDLHNAESRDFALRDIAGVHAVEETPLRSKLRGLLMQDTRGV